jgi:hypothetical protein
MINIGLKLSFDKPQTVANQQVIMPVRSCYFNLFPRQLSIVAQQLSCRGLQILF